jgi:Flp pilus assembly protein CpaB
MPSRTTLAVLGGLAAVAALALLAAACGGDDANDSPPPSETQIPSPVLAARADLARRLNVTPDSIRIQTIEEREWPDACLGLARSGEACAQVITPGYRAVFASDGQTYEYRTDRTTNFRPSF